tara:strand:+ start:968 stop:1252 length:285 start_codon:yes stop_codon:yes gene_type:complete
MDFNQSVENITLELKNINLLVENGKNALSIIVEKKFEIILTHYPLWNNEQFLYMVGDLDNKTLLKRQIPEKMIVEILLEIKKSSIFSSNETLLN